MNESIRRYLDENTGYLMKVLADLIAFETVAPPGKCYPEIIDYLIPIFDDMGFKAERILMPQEVFEAKRRDSRLFGERVNLLARMDTGAEETLAIYTHLDVVPPGEGWSSDPFALDLREGRAFGRGVCDCKGAVAGLIAALRAVIKTGHKPKYNLEVLLTTDEEVGGYSGLCYLTDEGLVRGDKMLCMDTTSDDVVIGNNGLITWEVTVRGVAAHSGASFMGENAIEKSVPVMAALLDLKAKIESRRSSLPANSSLRELGVDRLMPILNITMINGGIKENIVPDRCVLKGDRRVIPEETMEEAMDEIKRTIASLESPPELEFHPGYPPMRIDPGHPWVAEVRDAVRASTGREMSLSGMQGTIDQAYATKVTGIPSCVFGVGRQIESNIHGPDENARISDLLDYPLFLAELIAD